MHDKPTQEQIAKLPKWAQDYITGVEREREISIRMLNKWKDDQTKSPFYVEEVVCTGEEKAPSFKNRYIQTRSINVDHGGVHLRVILREEGTMHSTCIDLQWSRVDDRNGDVAFIPTSYQAATLVARENMGV